MIFLTANLGGSDNRTDKKLLKAKKLESDFCYLHFVYNTYIDGILAPDFNPLSLALFYIR
ncbi:hypothetical protein A0J48_006820 [Sphaerospermopsis aphanizomenoides BCCUSP55]|uniref:hypothetical protein n=1 Tax=Sphaerospermopsis aphanizomenoides TaxID=459663 RepID=UPI001908DC73|nr:hypothetical protein [Sphaerospermopsis aphanizomenoides]MBK1987249.1 hypothetical protein [Sphaerospermopsis aphanizomenoides BCCUSP55]